MADDRVFMSGNDRRMSSPRPPHLGGVPAWVLALAVTAAVIVGIPLLGTDRAAPPEPAEADPVPLVTVPPLSETVHRSEVPEVALGWVRLDLTGNGSSGTIVALVHGESGWMALGDGEQATVATSKDAQVWVTRTFPGSLDGEVRALVAGSRLVVIDSSVADRHGARSWISADGGVTWDSMLLPGGFVRVESLVESGTRLFAGGVQASQVGDPGENPGPTAAAVWEFSRGVWSPVGFADPPGRYSGISEVVVGLNGLMAFGHAGDRPAVWRLEGSSLVPEPVSLPRQLERGAFASVVQSIDGWWLAEFAEGTAVSYARSTDLGGWELLGSGYEGLGNAALAATNLGVVHVGEDDERFRIVDDSGVVEVRYRYPETATGFEPDRHTARAASDGAVIAMGGGRYSPALWLRGLTSGQTAVTAEPAVGDGRWRAEQVFGHGSVGEAPRPFQVVRFDGELVIATPQGVLRTSAPGIEVIREGVVAARLVTTADTLYMIDAESRLLRDDGAGSWVAENLAISVAGMTVTPWGMMAYGPDERGATVVAVRRYGEQWHIVPPDSSAAVHPVAAAGGLIIGFEEGRSPPDGGLVTADGVTWAPFEIDGLRGLDSGVPFLVTDIASRSTTIEFIDEERSITVPSIDPLEVVRVGTTVRVRCPGRLWETTDDGASWVSYPVGIEHRTAGSIRIIPTEQLSLLARGRGSYQILTFED